MAVFESDGLLEREHQLAVLDAVLDGSAPGASRVAVVERRARTRKTRLLATALDTAAARRIAAVRVRGGDLEREFAFVVVRQPGGRVSAGAGGGRGGFPRRRRKGIRRRLSVGGRDVGARAA